MGPLGELPPTLHVPPKGQGADEEPGHLSLRNKSEAWRIRESHSLAVGLELANGVAKGYLSGGGIMEKQESVTLADWHI